MCTVELLMMSYSEEKLKVEINKTLSSNPASEKT